MAVQELNKEELAELKEAYFYREDLSIEEFNKYNYSDEIPDSVIFDHYGSTYFVKEDFFCNL